ncbi:MAG: molybdate ABC transporter substrate-binding protein [Methanosarcinales archaeon]|nr:molybdate ABC transporter substrate-binding protein [Methanosarcinales archaeon]
MLPTAVMAGLVLISTAPGSLEQEEIVVFCAASLTGAFKEIGDMYQESTGIEVSLNFDGTQVLRTQLEQGACADVFVSANRKHMDALMAQGLMINDTVQVFTENSMVVIVPKDNPADIRSLRDLERPGVKIVMGTRDVPVGSYALQVLDKLAEDPDFGPLYRDRVLSNVISREMNVNYVVSKISLGEADAGFAYSSDVTPVIGEKVSAIEIPQEYNVLAEYTLGVLAQSENPALARDFIEAVNSEEGRSILTKYGFKPVGLQPEVNSSLMLDPHPSMQAGLQAAA